VYGTAEVGDKVGPAGGGTELQDACMCDDGGLVGVNTEEEGAALVKKGG